MHHDQPSIFPRVHSVIVGTLMLGLLVGCDSILSLESDAQHRLSPHPLPAADSTIVEPGLKATLQTPDTVTTGDAFEVRTGVENQTGRSVTVTTGSTALWDLGIYDGDEVVPVEGTMLLYATVVTDHTIEPGADASPVDLRAVRSSNGDEPIAPGTYTSRLTLNWKIDGTTVKDTLRTTIVFQEK